MAETGKDRLSRIESKLKELPEGAWQEDVTWLVTVVRKLAVDLQKARESETRDDNPKKNWNTWQECELLFGKHRGKNLEEIVETHPDYIVWMSEKMEFRSKRLREAVMEARAYLDSLAVATDEEEEILDEDVPAPPLETIEDVKPTEIPF